MARRLLLPVLLALLASPARAEEAPACPSAALQPLALPRLAEALREGREPVVVAFGSSSTQGAYASSPDRAYPARLEAALRRMGIPVRVLNRGRGGEDALEMRARLEADVMAARPTVVIWQLGVNGAIREQSLARFRTLLRQGVTMMQEAGADVVLMDSQRGPWVAAHAVLRDLFDATLAEVAQERGAQLFSRRRMMDEWVAAGTPDAAMIARDGLHHNDRGYACLAEAVANGIRTSISLSR
ncbi:SGNH/GDSL hydrolase family protein [Pararoseomonas indoligenes]|uniref:SGNH/GDSL hydrolase family protein n=1 Tax=Roseomonas indoligenes TaxID=2820811 RepID=A0A940N3T9_9PROT|nr:GDSL-type esterase/lipase family protein [Pararoseomonas indoligenes]MBP0494675.1 SGNH/GDSL hydrolase family protein [Pararoseomonas indoligenes]